MTVVVGRHRPAQVFRIQKYISPISVFIFRGLFLFSKKDRVGSVTVPGRDESMGGSGGVVERDEAR